jgi:hypothetical protein
MATAHVHEYLHWLDLVRHGPERKKYVYLLNFGIEVLSSKLGGIEDDFLTELVPGIGSGIRSDVLKEKEKSWEEKKTRLLNTVDNERVKKQKAQKKRSVTTMIKEVMNDVNNIVDSFGLQHGLLLGLLPKVETRYATPLGRLLVLWHVLKFEFVDKQKSQQELEAPHSEQAGAVANLFEEGQEQNGTAMGPADSPKSIVLRDDVTPDANGATVPLRNAENRKRPREDQEDDQETTAANSQHIKLSQCPKRPRAESDQEPSTLAGSPTFSTMREEFSYTDECEQQNEDRVPPLVGPSSCTPPLNFSIPERFFPLVDFPMYPTMAQPFQVHTRCLMYRDYYKMEGTNDSSLMYLWYGPDCCFSLQQLKKTQFTATKGKIYSYYEVSIEILQPLLGSEMQESGLLQMIKQSDHWRKGKQSLSLIVPTHAQKHGMYCLLQCIVPTESVFMELSQSA